MKKLLIIAKLQDKATLFFQTQKIKSLIKIDYLLYEESKTTIEEFLKNNSFDYIYIRDPFLKLSHPEIKEKLSIIFANSKQARLIDNLKSIADVFLEDKWKQYQKFPEVFPQTRLVASQIKPDFSKEFVKERISSMAKGVVFSLEEMKKDQNYLAQKKINIKKEYRVFSLFGETIDLMMVKSSKIDLTTKILGQKTEPLSEEIKTFVKKVDKVFKFDFAGYDVAVDEKGKLYLLEVNRSCYFGAFYRLSGINLAEVFVKKLLESK